VVPGELVRGSRLTTVDLVTLFAVVVFAIAWFFHARTPPDEALVRLFFGFLLFLSAGAGLLGLVGRLMTL